MSNGNWVNEVGNQGMMFLFCSVRQKKEIGRLFFYGGKPHCQNSGQTVGRRESLYEFSSSPIERNMYLLCRGLQIIIGTFHCFINHQIKCFSVQVQVSGWQRIRKFPWELHTQLTDIHWKRHGVISAMYLTFITAIGRKPDFNKI